MKRSLIRYRTKPERTEENERLIKGVFAELQAKSPAGVRYLALKLGDGSFIHFVAVDDDAGANPVTRLAAFQAFQSGVKDRCLELPQSNDVTVVGNYRMLEELAE